MDNIDTGAVEGKVAIVTGAGGGIGRDVALLLARHGAAVVVNDVGAYGVQAGEEGPAAKVVAEIKAAGGQAVAHTGSVADAESGTAMVELARREFGRVDCVVNNAGIVRDRFFHKMTDEEWDPVIKVHLYGSWYLSRAAGAVFKEQGSGSLVHMTSTAGLIGNRAQANYAAAKMGLVGLSRSIAMDLERFNVRSNCIAPAAWTRMVESIPITTPEQQALAEKKKRVMTSAKIAPLVVYLASDMARHVTGQIFGVRGNELFVFDQPRPVRSVQRAEGWTPRTIAEHAMPAFEPKFSPLTQDAFTAFPYEPV
jgi:NAD(P)-dependent dehydrogenase (short-subunit alcohol dehydrogenase family)